MKNRIKRLREVLRLSQGEFAEKIGLKRAAVSLIEIGKSNLTEQNIKLICLIMNVNESWIRTGEGPMFNKEVPGEREILDLFRQISQDGRKIVLDYVRLILKNEQTFSSKVPEPPQAAEKQEASPKPEPEPPQVAEILPGPEPDPDLTGKNRA
jgi:transcriptional regulator with XRE-family HTH domain